MNKGVKILLIAVAVACFGVALYYPLHYQKQQSSNSSNMEELAALRMAGMASEDQAETTDETGEAEPSAPQERTAPAEPEAPETAPDAQGEAPEAEPQGEPPEAEPQGELPAADAQGESPAEPQGEAPAADAQGESADQGETETISTVSGGEEEAAAANVTVEATGGAGEIAATSPNPIAAVPKGESTGAEGGEVSARPEGTGAEADEATPAPTPTPSPTPKPSPTPNRRERSGVLPYSEKEKVEFDEDKILGRYKSIYELNKDLVGWIIIPGTDVDYPVVQTKEEGDYYLKHDFFGEENANGQIILDPLCDPYTPSYNLVISGHNMRSGSMFGNLDRYTSKSYWSSHKLLQFDTLMNERHYVIIAAFYSADYDVDETGFRYNADIQYRVEAEQWLSEVRKNRLYDTGIDAEFGDEFLTLTTCNYARRKDGRFVLVCRRIREGETFE